ncbi:MAG: bifunctional diaminohydroxyphosphoribosylaminopyrimidine deaminase/5-amino-6-(5-phosphoribosylamino)uracil reductase RibD [Lautropia sp.]
MYTDADRRHMSHAITIAANGLNTTAPNPRVGCVIVAGDTVVGEGWHRYAGEPHAEVLALAQAGGRARGATVYVTLEPCSHHGRTPPCTDMLIDAGVGRVIAAMEDPNPLVNGNGLAALRAAGIDVRCGLMNLEAVELNPGFVSRMTRKRPWMRMKVAATIDGQTGLADGRSQWITGEAARVDGHRWRARACAILTGIGTVKADNPAMTVRHVETARQPVRVLIDSRLEVNPAAELLRTPGTIVFHALGDAAVHGDRRARLVDAGCELVSLPDANGKVDLRAALLDLGRRQFNEVHVEAGYKLNGSLMADGCIDELLLYIAPSLIGAGQPMFGLTGVQSLDARIAMRWLDVERVGDDLRLRARTLPPDARRGGERPVSGPWIDR